VQGGVFVTDRIELFARWDMLFPDDDLSPADHLRTLTFGGNHYFVAGSHAAKLTADVQLSLDDQDALTGLTRFAPPSHTTGTLPSDEADQWMVRLQMQLVF
jgi:hypothetical protein